MRDISNSVPHGLSWGIRGFFRIGKSVRGNWWISLGLPLGFRYVWMLGSSSKKDGISAKKQPTPQLESKNPSNTTLQPQINADSRVVNRQNKKTSTTVQSKIIRK